MTIHVCDGCGKFFNSDELDKCPFCGKKVKDNQDLKHVNI